MLNSMNTWEDLARAKFELAIIPIGSMEQHGPHLPLATDFIIADTLAKKVGERLGAFVLPCLPFSCSQEHSDFPGTVWLSPATLTAVLTDIVLSLYEHNIRQIAIINQHGGNHIIKPVVLELNKKYPGLRLTAHKATPITPAVQKILSSRKSEEVHAGELETSLLEAIVPDLVRKNKAQNYVPDVPFDYLEFFRMQRLSPTGIWGNASLAARTKGEELWEVIVEEVSGMVEEAMSRLKSAE
jgi:creatinine amidohydrolase